MMLGKMNNFGMMCCYVKVQKQYVSLGSAWKRASHLVGVPLALCQAAAAHDGVDVDVSVEAGGRKHRRVPGAPLHVKAPLVLGGQLVQHLNGSGWGGGAASVTEDFQNDARRRLGYSLTSPVFGFQHRILLSLPQLRSSSGSAALQAMARTPLPREKCRGAR